MIMDNGQLIPDLRFPEFEGDWQKSTLKKSYSIITGSTPPTSDKSNYGEDYLFVSPADLGKEKFVTNTKTMLSKKGFDKSRSVEKGAVFFVCIGSTIGKVGQAHKESCTNQQINSLQARNNHFNDFGYYLLEKNGPKIKLLAGVQAVPQLNKTDFSNLKFYFPNFKEQQKIANFLTAIDQRITKLKEKKAALEDYKKGLMQKIFSQEIRFNAQGCANTSVTGCEGEVSIKGRVNAAGAGSAGAAKHDEGNDFPDWEVKLFSKLYEFKRTNSFSRDKLNNQSGEIQNIHYGDIHTKFKSHFNINDEDVPYVNDEVDLSKVKVDEFIQAGDLIIADASEDYDDIGKVIEATNVDDKKIIAGLHTFLARRINDKLSVGFAGLMMQSEHVRLQIKKIAQGTKVLGISMGRLSKIKLKIPCPEEQQKIANFLTAIDQKINAMDKQIADLELFKKGLLQRMFV